MTARQRGIRGFDQKALADARFLIVGCGGLGGHISHGLVRKGAGTLFLCDHDTVELSNLNRQLFGPRDLYQNKAERLARNLSVMGYCGTELVPFPMSFEELVDSGHVPECDLLIAGVDSDRTRANATRFCLTRSLRHIILGVSRDANDGYAFAHAPGSACLGCVLPDLDRSAEQDRTPCPGSPACLDILLVVSGLAVYAADSLLMKRPRSWNFRRLFLSGEGGDVAWSISRRPGCSLCAQEAP